MIYKIARFTVKKTKLDECKKAISQFVHTVRAREPGTVLYESFIEKDGVTFQHFMVFKDKRAEELHSGTKYVKAFTGFLYPNCSKKPVFTELSMIASSRMRRK